ncbi:outer membrane protein [Bartonella sp. DGB1]|uniref:outer membrane protein n=1 Tax=Bartonella sp. DGB1 TaxID=3239807 RepID=UPI003523B9A9
MKLKYVIAASVATLFTVSSVNAADLRRDLRPASVVLVKPTFTWNGSYGGIQAAYAKMTYKGLASEAKADDSPATRELSHNRDAIGLGAFIGFNSASTQGFVVGAEADAQYYFLRDISSNATDGFPDVADVKNQVNLALRARLGVSVGHVLPYLAAGITGTYTNRDIAATADTKAGPNNAIKVDGFTFGWTLGAGVDVALADNMLVRLEYRYNDLGKTEKTVMNTTDGKPDTNTQYVALKDPSATSGELRLGLGYKY